MKKRDFLRLTAATGGLALFGNALSVSRYKSQAHGVKPFELEEVTIPQLQQEMRMGKYSARSLVELYVGRIKELDQQLHSVIELNPDAVAIAESLDAERQAGKVRGMLHGIPILLKDNIDTGDKMTTTAGSLALEGSIAKQDAFLAAQLRKAGAVIVGKANLSEWANFRSPRSSSGWSGRGGQCRNPYVLDRSPSGSSSGSAVSVAANLIAVAVGTETDGSIVSPASANSIVGIKPTLGLISRAGVIPIAHSQDTAGPMARTVTDAAILLGAMTGIDPRDKATQKSKGKFLTNYTQFLDQQGLQGARIGVARKFFGFNSEVDRLMERSLEEIKKLGATLVDPVQLDSIDQIDSAEIEVLLYEFKADLNAYLASLDASVKVKSLEDVITFNIEHSDRELRYFGQEFFIAAQKKGSLKSSSYLKALKKCQLLARKLGIDAVMDKHRLDAIVAPTSSLPCSIDLFNGDRFSGGCSTPAAVAGYPHVTVPGGYVNELPFGISFFGRAYTEPQLIKYAYAFEQATQLRQRPKYLSTTEIL